MFERQVGVEIEAQFTHLRTHTHTITHSILENSEMFFRIIRQNDVEEVRQRK